MRSWLMRSLLGLLLIAAVVVIGSCQAREGYGERDEVATVPPPITDNPPAFVPRPVSPTAGQVDVPRPATPTAPMAKRVLPALDREPVVNVLLESASRVQFTLLAAADLSAGGRSLVLAAGACSAELVGDRLRVNGQALAGTTATITVRGGAGAAAFSALLHPPFGKPQTLKCAGQIVLAASHAHEVLLIERLRLEDYLAGVLPVEMTPTWPVEALKAQAIAARSYAVARYCERYDQPWQLHWHYSVDMAYGGVRASTANVRAALDQSRGAILVLGNLPVLALFHACSGGATEAVANLWPERRAADGVSSLAAAMPVVDDAAAEAGCRGLGFVDSHWRWHANVTFADLSDGLHDWTAEKPAERPAFGAVVSVRVVSRFPDSNRVATVAVRHRLGGRDRETVMAGHDFRMAAGPGVIRSTQWERCVIAAQGGGTLVVEGRGFGHGVGLSQVSAWAMAKQGQAAAAILNRFYPQTTVTKRW